MAMIYSENVALNEVEAKFELSISCTCIGDKIKLRFEIGYEFMADATTASPTTSPMHQIA